MPEEPHKFFDVAHPGKSAASASSRPVIVGNKPEAEDPMMVSARARTQGLQHSGGLQPLHQNLHVDDVADQPHIEKALSAEPAPEPGVLEKELDKLTDQQAYFVHINGAKQKKAVTSFMLLLGAMIAMAAAGYYTMLFLKK